MEEEAEAGRGHTRALMKLDRKYHKRALRRHHPNHHPKAEDD